MIMIVDNEVICLRKEEHMSITIGKRYVIDMINTEFVRIKNDKGVYNIYPDFYFMTIADYRNMLIEEILE
jgi:hypothetical protein